MGTNDLLAAARTTKASDCRSSRQVTHKIEENTDIERDYIVQTVSAASPVEVEVIETSPLAITAATAAVI